MTKIARQKNVHKIKYTIIIEFYGVIGLSLNTVRLYNEMRVSAGCQSVSALCSRSRGSYISRLVDWLVAPAYLADDCRLLSDVGRRPTGVNAAGDAGDTSPPIFWLVGTSTGISPPILLVLSDIADHYWLPYVRSASSRFHSVIRRHQFALVRQADSRLTRLVPPNLELALTPLRRPFHCGPIPMTCGSCLCHEHITNSVIGVSRPPVLDCGTTFLLDYVGQDLP